LPEAKGRKSAYIPTLDGWRAIAILFVIFYHDALHAVGIFSTRWFIEYGNIGVDVFFAISGILICTRLLDDERVCGRIHLQSFYVRRAFRILPPALCYISILALLARLLPIPVSSRELFGAIFFCRNYPRLIGLPNDASGWYTSHFWSLAIEEQFYFVLPALLLFTPRRFRAPILAFLAMLIAIGRVIALHYRPWIHIEFHTEVRIDALFVPALFAVLTFDPHVREIFKKWLRFWPIIVVGVACILPFGNGTWWRATLIVWGMPCIVLGSTLHPQSIFGRILELSVLRYIGRISYSLYLWQQLFFSQRFGPPWQPLGLAQGWPLRLVLTFACAIASYHLLESPLSRLGHKLAPSATPGRYDLDPVGKNAVA